MLHAWKVALCLLLALGACAGRGNDSPDGPVNAVIDAGPEVAPPPDAVDAQAPRVFDADDRTRIDQTFGSGGLVEFRIKNDSYHTVAPCLGAAGDRGILFGALEESEGIGGASFTVKLTFAGQLESHLREPPQRLFGSRWHRPDRHVATGVRRPGRRAPGGHALAYRRD